MKNRERAGEVKDTDTAVNERMNGAEEETQVAQSKRVHDRGSFSRFEAKHHLTGNLVIIALIIVLALLCAFSTVQIKLPNFSEDSEGVKVEQNMINLAMSFTAFFMTKEDENTFMTEYTLKMLEIEAQAEEKYGDDIEAMNKYIGKDLSKTEFAKYILIGSKNSISGDYDFGGEAQESSLIRSLENYIGFGTVMIGLG